MKDNRRSREEAAAFLEKDLKRAFRKGYTPKELCALFKKAGITIPERLIARYQEPVEVDGENRDLQSGKQGGREEKYGTVPSRQTKDVEAAKDIIPTSQSAAASEPKSEPVWRGTSPMIPDKPMNDTVAKGTTPTSKNKTKPKPKPEPVRYGTFTIIPDTPIGEL